MPALRAEAMMTFVDIDNLTGGRLGTVDTACPSCGPDRRSAANRRRHVLRIWHEADFASYHCARCGLTGFARRNGAKRIDHQQRERLKIKTAHHKTEHDQRQRAKAKWLWRRSEPAAGSIVQTYLMSRRIELDQLPATLRYLPPSGDYHPAMISAFGIPDEPEPGVLAIDKKAIAGVHLTLLKTDGTDKAGTERDKLMIGPSLGLPIVLAPLNDTLGLAITEGIEDALSVHRATGLGSWAAGSASRMPALADAVPGYTDCISIYCDDDNAGRDGARKLAVRLIKRGIEIFEVTL
jgi:hypothetical protein